ncbi:MAG: PilZ domain-containing protein [Thermodesulfobacteria bacterium]|nr:PilZ domain-containing protein [Thermodesulfobacteriota bacterium]
MSSFKERREEPRRKVELLVVFTQKGPADKGSEWIEGTIRDASPKGVRIFAPVVYEPDDILELYCLLPKGSDQLQGGQTFYRMEGRVVWRDESRGQMGIVFI